METNLGESNKEEGIEMESQPAESNKGKLVFIFIIGFLLGVSIKAQAVKSVTMGFNDYKLQGLKSDFVQVKKDQPVAVTNQSEDGTDDPGAAQPSTTTQPESAQPADTETGGALMQTK